MMNLIQKSLVRHMTCAIPFITAPMVSSDTPACKNAPLKSPLANAFFFLRKPSVLSELARSAEATIILGTWSAKWERSRAEALRFLEVLRQLPIEVDAMPTLTSVEGAFQLAHEAGLSLYDAAYLDLAATHGVPLATLDAALGIAAGVGILSGVYPAHKATKVSPLEAMRGGS